MEAVSLKKMSGYVNFTYPRIAKTDPRIRLRDHSNSIFSRKILRFFCVIIIDCHV